MIPLPIISYHPDPDFLSVLESGEIPLEIACIYLQEYKKRKTRYKIFIYIFFIIAVLLMFLTLAQLGLAAVLFMIFSLFLGCLFMYSVVTRMKACGKIIAVILKSYPELNGNSNKL